MNITDIISRRIYRDADLAVINNTAFIQPYEGCHRGLYEMRVIELYRLSKMMRLTREYKSISGESVGIPATKEELFTLVNKGHELCQTEQEKLTALEAELQRLPSPAGISAPQTIKEAQQARNAVEDERYRLHYAKVKNKVKAQQEILSIRQAIQALLAPVIDVLLAVEDVELLDLRRSLPKSSLDVKAFKKALFEIECADLAWQKMDELEHALNKVVNNCTYRPEGSINSRFVNPLNEDKRERAEISCDYYGPDMAFIHPVMSAGEYLDYMLPICHQQRAQRLTLERNAD
ncbi:hypothetical protein FGH87_00110 [Salmonella enterica]|uniref:Uncharacterized protein n=1 Tax=Salmonella enterica subsp. enterica serovar Lattenkamp TaxID=2564671 RepID=A0A5W2LZP3_SALET|nr:hypothetical protein [Salmonella enterica subsp. enterica serovar Lattenkamp]EAQ8611165.1 hypothetical protein [Salmonella enterica]ECJ3925127.1 hypothetical protein [Salmonella enterica subsp. enterica]EAR5593748.1 hypothetical protein [Salmonella enterica]EAV2733175.1 hypothetical protein [Salmonella enterica]